LKLDVEKEEIHDLWSILIFPDMCWAMMPSREIRGISAKGVKGLVIEKNILQPAGSTEFLVSE